MLNLYRKSSYGIIIRWLMNTPGENELSRHITESKKMQVTNKRHGNVI